MQPNIFLSVLLCCVPAFIAQVRKSTNTRVIDFICVIIAIINFVLLKAYDISLAELGQEGVVAVIIISGLVWFGCLIAAFVSPTEQTDKK